MGSLKKIILGEALGVFYHTYDTVTCTTFDLKNTNCLQIGTIKKKDKFIIIYWKKIWVIIFVKNLRHLAITVGEITL